MYHTISITEKDFLFCLKSQENLKTFLDKVSEKEGRPWRKYGAFRLDFDYICGEYSLFWESFDFVEKFEDISMDNNYGYTIFKYLSNQFNKTHKTKDVIKNIPYFQILSNFKNNNEEYMNKCHYQLNYAFDINHTSINGFDKSILEQIVKCMNNYTDKFIEYCLNFFNEYKLFEYSKEEIINKAKNNAYHKISLKECNEYKKFYNNIIETPKQRRKQRRKEFERELNLCPICRGGGCPSCEPSFFY